MKYSLAGLLTSSAIVTGAMIDSARADEDSPWLVRVRAVAVVTDVDASVTGLSGTVDIDNDVIPELDITYFFSDHWAAELVLGTSNHDVTATAGVDLGDVWLLPPTLTLQYHFMPKAQFRPYVGAGVNYTIFYGADSGAVASIEYDNAFGFALQGGMDYDLGDNWVFNVDVKKIWLSTDASINGGAVTAEVDIDPWFFGTGIGYRF
ncbi:MAG: outer membrane beta-barrel protein [Parvibaculaceae bacterium]|nr:outer membrane beta-barrel protein [Parvibaculaceae bacterium]